jgi:hypothetical protein
MLKKTLIGVFLISSMTLWGQEEASSPAKVEFKGYLKNLQTTLFVKPEPSADSYMLTDQLLHNRLNFRWYAGEKMTFFAELRNRLFWGDLVKLNPAYIADTDKGSDDFFDWSAGWRSRKGCALHTNLDRFYGEWTIGQWEVRLGRQRVNWGISTTWNPNDIFNAYNFTDFDYEERPGSDALRIRYFSGVASSLELAVKASDNWEDFTAGLLGKFHSGSYDWQVLGGVTENHAVAGGGWAGNLGTASFKGEVSAFFPLAEEGETSLSAAFGLDYTFSNQMYVSGGMLFNSSGADDNAALNIFDSDLSARQLFPYRYATLLLLAYPVTPLLNTSLVVLYGPGEANMLFLNPTITASIAQNWDLDVVGQFVFQKLEKYESPVQAGYVRLKWSF